MNDCPVVADDQDRARNPVCPNRLLDCLVQLRGGREALPEGHGGGRQQTAEQFHMRKHSADIVRRGPGEGGSPHFASADSPIGGRSRSPRWPGCSRAPNPRYLQKYCFFSGGVEPQSPPVSKFILLVCFQLASRAAGPSQARATLGIGAVSEFGETNINTMDDPIIDGEPGLW